MGEVEGQAVIRLETLADLDDWLAHRPVRLHLGRFDGLYVASLHVGHPTEIPASGRALGLTASEAIRTVCRLWEREHAAEVAR